MENADPIAGFRGQRGGYIPNAGGDCNPARATRLKLSPSVSERCPTPPATPHRPSPWPIGPRRRWGRAAVRLPRCGPDRAAGRRCR